MRSENPPTRQLTVVEVGHLRNVWLRSRQWVPPLWGTGALVFLAFGLDPGQHSLLLGALAFGLVYWETSSRVRHIRSDLDILGVEECIGLIEYGRPKFTRLFSTLYHQMVSAHSTAWY